MTFTADLRMYRHSGIGRYLRNLVPQLFPLLQTDTIRVLGSRAVLGEPAWLRDPRVRFLDTRAPVYSMGEQLLGVGSFLQPRHAGDVLWVPHFNAPLVYRGRTVLTMHDVAPLAMPEILGSPLKRAYARLLIERAVSRASAILCVSEFTRNELAGRLAVPEVRMTVTHPGLDADWPLHATPHVEADGLPYFLFVGNVKPNKNLSLLLRAFDLLRHRLPHRLILAGQFRGLGTGDHAVLREVERLGDRAVLAGPVDDAKLQQLYAGASALVLPSLYEGFGLPLLEAMSLGCPVLCSTAGSLPEVGGNAALYFDPRSADELAACMLRVTDPVAMDDLRARGAERVKQFSFSRCAEQTAAVLNRLLQGAR